MEGQIAIIIPVYNTELYLAECLDSLLAQTYPNWVAYCVDDGSKDKSGEILIEYAAKDNRIKIFRKENGGASSARNYALDRLDSEEWLSFVDADDFVSPYMYEAIMNAIGRNEKVDYVRLYSQRVQLRYSDYIKNSWPESASATSLEIDFVDYKDYFVFGQVGGFSHSLFVKADVVKGNNQRFCEDMRVLEDQVFSITCATYCNNFLLLKSPRNYFYYSGNELSVTRTNRDGSDDIVRCINRVYGAFERRGDEVVMKDYFLGQYLPSKLDTLYGQILRHPFTRRKETIGSFKKVCLSRKSRIKGIIARIIESTK